MPAGARASASGNPHAVDATASTLNYALGRRHMKSWMTGAPTGPSTGFASPAPNPVSKFVSNPAPAPVSKRGRPGKYPVLDVGSQQHATAAARPQNAPSAERLLSSNSTSPQLANIVTNHERTTSRNHANITVFPSPTPSEEDVHGGEVHNAVTQLRQMAKLNEFDTALLDGSTQPATSPKRRSGEYEVPAEKRLRVATASFAQPDDPIITPPTASSELPPLQDFLQQPPILHAQGEHSSNRASSHSQPLDQTSDGQLAYPQLERVSQHQDRAQAPYSNPSPVDRYTAQSQAAHGSLHLPRGSQPHFSPPVPAQPFGISQSAPQTTRPLVNQASPPTAARPFDFAQFAPQAVQYQRFLPSQLQEPHVEDWYLLETCMQKLETFRATNSVRSRRDDVRLLVLQQAVRTTDWAYLTLHQYYCVMTCPERSLPQDLRRNQNLNTAFWLMQDILDDNRQLTPLVLQFFCDFPFPIHYLSREWPERYQHAENAFGAFVSYSPKVAVLRQACERRRVAPTPREMANCAITSSTFQRLLFRSITRFLWRNYPRISEQEAFEEQALQAFHRGQATFDQLRSLGQLGEQQQADEELRVWTHEFVQIAQSFETVLRRQGFHPIGPASPSLRLQQELQPQPQRQPQSFSQGSHHPFAPHTADNLIMSRRTQQQPPPPQAARRRTSSQTQASPRVVQSSSALLPRTGVIQPQQRVPNPSRFGLHQAHLRTPILKAAFLSSPGYYYWQGFIKKPARVFNANNAIEKLSFVLPKEKLEHIAKSLPTALGATESRAIDTEHKTIRLRCVKWSSTEGPVDSEWAITDNSWIPHSFFTFNGTSLQLRKKVHHGKDLPVDLTGLVKEGTNVLEVSVMNDASDTSHHKYMVAIEYLGIMTQTSIKKHCYKEKILAEETVAGIRRKLSPSSTSDDDDFVVVESTLTINLRDSFDTSKICDTPVRGKSCLHNECFDLDTFLQSRPRKGDVSVADKWHCPICRADARPNVLVMDEFLVNVRKELASKGLLETRAILVDQDGSWKPKQEERDPKGVQDRDTPEPAPTSARPSISAACKVIDLDSD